MSNNTATESWNLLEPLMPTSHVDNEISYAKQSEPCCHHAKNQDIENATKYMLPAEFKDSNEAPISHDEVRNTTNLWAYSQPSSTCTLSQGVYQNTNNSQFDKNNHNFIIKEIINDKLFQKETPKDSKEAGGQNTHGLLPACLDSVSADIFYGLNASRSDMASKYTEQEFNKMYSTDQEPCEFESLDFTYRTCDFTTGLKTDQDNSWLFNNGIKCEFCTTFSGGESGV